MNHNHFNFISTIASCFLVLLMPILFISILFTFFIFLPRNIGSYKISILIRKGFYLTNIKYPLNR